MTNIYLRTTAPSPNDILLRDPTVADGATTDISVDQIQAAQEQSAQAEAVSQAPAFSGGYYSGRILPDTRRLQPERKKKERPKKIPHGLSWPAKWPETIPEILPPLQLTTDCAIDQAQARQDQRILGKTAQGWEPFEYQPEAFRPEAIRIQPPPAPRRTPAWPAVSSPIQRPAASRAPRRAPGGGSSKRTTEEEELLVIIAASD